MTMVRPAGVAGSIAELSDEAFRSLTASGQVVTDAAVAEWLTRRAPLLGEGDAVAVVGRVSARAHGLGGLEALLADESVTEVLVTGGRHVWVERGGSLAPAGVHLAPGEAEHVVERVLGPIGARADRTSPIADARLADGTRVHVVVPPAAPDGVCLSVRRFSARAVALDAFTSPVLVELLGAAVAARLNIVVSGATSSGKTTLLNALAAQVGEYERIVTIEDTCELRVPRAHVARLEARAATADGVGAISIRQLVRAALRMRPDRIVVGEVRGAEAFDMLQALSTGHDGSLSTCHANDADDALRRLATMAVQAGEALPIAVVRQLVCAAVDLVVHVRRGQGGRRVIATIAEVTVGEHGEPVARTIARDGRLTTNPSRVGRAVGAEVWWVS